MIQSGTKGSKDRTKKMHDSPAESRHSKETSDIIESSEAAQGTESEYSRSTRSSDASREVSTETSSTSPPIQDDIDTTIQSVFTIPGLSEHRHICLVEYSVLRAFVQNASLLAIDPSLFIDDYALSPWTISNPCPTFTPHDLSPTLLQLSTPHHPYIDMIAPPSLRDNVLLSILTDEQEDQLCISMHSGSFTIWGSQPWTALGMYLLPSFVIAGQADIDGVQHGRYRSHS